MRKPKWPKFSLPRASSISFDRARWHWIALRWRQRLGTLGLAAVAGVLVLILVHCLLVHPRLQQAEQRLSEVRQALARPMPAAKAGAAAAGRSTDEQLQAVFDVLRQHNLATPEAQYRQSRGAPSSKHPGRLTVELPLMGDYQNLRAALQDISDLRDVRVDRVSMLRPALETDYLSINLRVSLGG